MACIQLPDATFLPSGGNRGALRIGAEYPKKSPSPQPTVSAALHKCFIFLLYCSGKARWCHPKTYLQASCVIEMARKKIREYDSKRLLKAHILRLKNIKLPLNVTQVSSASGHQIAV